MHDRLFLGLVCFAILVGACRTDRSVAAAGGDVGGDVRVDEVGAAEGGAADRGAVDAGAKDVGGEAAAPDAIDLPPARGPDAEAPRADAGRDTAASPPATCGPGTPREALCLSYCDGIGRFCGGASTQYRNADECRTACNAPASTWSCGQPGDVTGNSLFCRLSHMALAGVGAAATECPNAGPNSPVCQ